MTTREGGVRGMELELPEGRGDSAGALQLRSSMPAESRQATGDGRPWWNMGVGNPGTVFEFWCPSSELVFSAFLDTSKRECYHQRQC